MDETVTSLFSVLCFHCIIESLASLPEQNRRGLRRDQASRRMVALYDYDPRESSPNVDVEVRRLPHLELCVRRPVGLNPCRLIG